MVNIRENEMPIISIRGLLKEFQGQKVLKGIDLDVRKGEIISFIGASGGGKSTLLRCINLLETYDGGTIEYHGRNIKDRAFSVPSYRQKVGMIFQRFNLFNNMTVLDNVNIGQIKVLGRSREEATKKSLNMLKKVGMDSFAHKDVRKLSGGQMQRVAIARALSMDPEVLLLDEPTSALDPQMVDEVLAVIREIADEGLTLLIVTHEMRFAEQVSDRTAFLKDGLIKEIGDSEKIFRNPESDDLRRFLRK